MQPHDWVITNRDTTDARISTWDVFKAVNKDAMDDADFAAIEDILDKNEIYAEPPGAFAGWSVGRFMFDASDSEFLAKDYLRIVEWWRELHRSLRMQNSQGKAKGEN